MTGQVIRLSDHRPVERERLLKTAELCRLTGFSESTVRRWAREPGFPRTRWGSHWRYRLGDVERWMEHRSA